MKPDPSIVVCDIDGTVAAVGPARAAMLREENPDWDAFYEDPFDDEPIEKVCRLVRHLSMHYHIVFCTSRRDSVREKTVAWLKSNLDADSFPHGFTLLMRRGRDPRPDTTVKPELLLSELTLHGLDPTAVLCVLEDSEDMAKSWTDRDFTCVKVA